jgi:hypothetical protein
VSDRPWCYFGCGDQAGHYIFPEGRSGTHGYGRPILERLSLFDGKLAPFNDRTPYRAVFSRIGSLGYTALSWWDNTVDKRPGSNSTIFCPTIVMTPVHLLAEGQRRFPWVFARLPEPLKIVVVT